MNKQKKELKQKLLALGLSPKTSERYADGSWAIPDSIKNRMKKNENQ